MLNIMGLFLWGFLIVLYTISLLYKIWLKIPIRGRWRGSLTEVKMKQILGQNSEIVRWLLRFIFLKVLNTKPDMSMLETFASFLLYSSTTMYLFSVLLWIKLFIYYLNWRYENCIHYTTSISNMIFLSDMQVSWGGFIMECWNLVRLACHLEIRKFKAKESTWRTLLF